MTNEITFLNKDIQLIENEEKYLHDSLKEIRLEEHLLKEEEHVVKKVEKILHKLEHTMNKLRKEYITITSHQKFNLLSQFFKEINSCIHLYEEFETFLQNYENMLKADAVEEKKKHSVYSASFHKKEEIREDLSQFLGAASGYHSIRDFKQFQEKGFIETFEKMHRRN